MNEMVYCLRVYCASAPHLTEFTVGTGLCSSSESHCKDLSVSNHRRAAWGCCCWWCMGGGCLSPTQWFPVRRWKCGGWNCLFSLGNCCSPPLSCLRRLHFLSQTTVTTIFKTWLVCVNVLHAHGCFRKL